MGHTHRGTRQRAHADSVFQRFYKSWSDGAAGAAVQLAGANSGGSADAASATAAFAHCAFRHNSAVSLGRNDVSQRGGPCTQGVSNSSGSPAGVVLAQNLAVVSLEQSSFSSNDVMYDCPPVLVVKDESSGVPLDVLQSVGMPAVFSDAVSAGESVIWDGSRATIQAAERMPPPRLQRLLLSAGDAELAEIVQVRTQRFASHCSWLF
jgi:hypothetical protein